MYAGQKNMQKCLVKSETLHTFVVGTDAISINKVHNSNAIWRCLLSTFSYADCVGSQNLTRQRLFLYTKLLTDKWEPKLKAQWPRITVTAVHNPHLQYAGKTSRNNPAIIGIPSTQTNSAGRYLPSNATYTAWKSRDHNPAPAITPVKMYISNVYTKNDTRISRSDVPSSTLWKAVAARALLTSESIVVLYTSNVRASASNRATS